MGTPAVPLPASTAHPAKMLPQLARRIIAEYSPPGGLVVDPLCGIGTTLVEAAHLGRHVIGVEYEARWAELARANLAHAAGQGAPGSGRVLQGDARQFTSLLDPEVVGRVALVLTSPPYGSSVHSQANAEPGRDVAKWHDRSGRDPAGSLGAWYAVELGGRFLGEARDLEQALGMLQAAMDAKQVWPDIWVISDHGNPHRLGPDQP
jgi:tRNA G10  N-methylase Trm11